MNTKSLPRSLSVHPVVSLLSWIGFLLAFQHMEAFYIQVLSLMLLLLALLADREKMQHMLHKTRWLFYSMLLLYLVPVAWQFFIGDFNANQGVAEAAWGQATTGLTQCLHLLAVLSSLILLIGRMGTSELIDGIYHLISPLAWFGIDIKKLSVRLMLTMQQVEVMAKSNNGRQEQLLEGIFTLPEFESRSIELDVHRLGWLDRLLILFILLIVLYLFS